MKMNPFEKILDAHIENNNIDTIREKIYEGGNPIIENEAEDILDGHILSNRAEILSDKQFNVAKDRLAELEDQLILLNQYDQGETENLIKSLKTEVDMFSRGDDSITKKEIKELETIVDVFNRKEEIVIEVKGLVNIIREEYLKRGITSQQNPYLN